VINLDSSDKLRKKYKTTNKAKWLILKIYEENGKVKRTNELLTSDLKFLKSFSTKSDYDPRKRPWFLKANTNNGMIKTDAYIFSNLEAYGTTYAKKIKDSNTVVSVDISLKSMSSFLRDELTISNSEVYLSKENGVFTSHATLNKNLDQVYSYKKDLILPNYKYLKNKPLDNNSEFFNLGKIDNKKYYIYYSKLKSLFNNSEYISIFLPYDVVMKDYNNRIIFSTVLTFLVFLFIMPFVWILTRLLVNPIEQLSIENQKISRFEFDEVNPIITNIKEFKELSLSLVSMAKSIKKHREDEIKLMDSFIKIIASAIDAKSKYTGGHCERVPVLSMMIAKEASDNKDVFKDFTINNKEEERELNVSAWLHDCGKVTTPEYVVDKATKLETIYNRIHEIRTRFEVIHRDLTIQSLKNILNGASEGDEKKNLNKEHEKLYSEFSIVAKANIGSEHMDDNIVSDIENISKRTWLRNFDNSIGISRDEVNRLLKNENINTPAVEYLLSNKIEHIIEKINEDTDKYKKYKFKLEVPEHLYNLGEVYNLSVQKGTLTKEERYKINEHSIMSIVMLEELPFKNVLKNVSIFATCHHETLIGTGYPRKLKKEDMPLPSRIIAIADVFEALTSSDRPYKEAKTLSESIKILSLMVKDKHLDEDIFKMFLKTGVYKKYADNYLEATQIDEVDISLYL
jgi:HD-GYP domain-containing protein (c-di-GMP phosphodiesterase class II)